MTLLCVYQADTRAEEIANLEEMRGYLHADETDLLELTNSTLEKLRSMSDEAFAALDLLPDFEPGALDDIG